MEQNKTGKYLKYAIGEIVLVVIGILIALSINNWNTQRINSVQEKEILLQLKDEYEKNLTQLNQKIQLRKSIIHSCFQLLSYRREKASIVELDSFNYHLSRLYTTPTFDPALGVSTELSNSGKLYLIKDHELRNLITTWPSFLSQLREEELNVKEWVETRFNPFLIENYQIGASLELSWTDDGFNSLSALSKTEHSSLSGLFDKIPFDVLLNHPDFEDHLALIMSNHQWSNQQAIGVKEELNKIITNIDTGLKKWIE